MLPEPLRETIQAAYRDWLAAEQARPRRVQREMIAAITRTLGRLFAEPERDAAEVVPIAVIEAGTGTGKTLAYALAVLPLARSLGAPVVIATATTTLQEQLIQRDLPRLQAHTGLAFRFAIAKGRQRYLCPLRLSRLLQGEPMQDDLIGEGGQRRIALAPFQALAEAWSEGRWDGDRDHWPQALEEALWRPISTDHRGCLGNGCPEIARCCFYRARAELQDADCIVTNHDLVLADLALGGGAVLPAPEQTLYVFDEAHRLPEKALGHFAASFRLGSALEWLQKLHEDLGGLARAGHGWLGASAARSAAAADAELSVPVEALRLLDAWLAEWLAGQRADQDAEGRLRLPAVLPPPLAEAAARLQLPWVRLSRALADIEAGVLAALGHEQAAVALEAEPWYARIGAHRARVEAASRLWQAYGRQQDLGGMPPVRWLKSWPRDGGVDIELVYSPLLPAGQLSAQLWQRCLGAVLVSATLAPMADFSTFRMRCGLPEGSACASLPSPFDYAGSATLVVPAMRSDPGNPGQHTRELIDLLPRRLDPEEASLVLFASRQQMLEVLDSLPAAWRARILCQEHLPREALLAEHRQRVGAGQSSVIFGLASFAEGVDLPGDECTHVVIAKLPFPVPDSPLEAAMADWLRAQGRDPFRELVLPDTALRLVQACGRLLRSEADCGRITLMDRRIVSRRYGRTLLSALPPYRLVVE